MTKSKQISVRLSPDQQHMLDALLKDLNKNSVVDIAAADVMRVALEQFYVSKIQPNQNLQH